MATTRYWRLEALPPARGGVTLAMVHFALLGFTLRALYLSVSGSEKRPWSPPPMLMPEKEFAVYVGHGSVQLLASELRAIIFEHVDA